MKLSMMVCASMVALAAFALTVDGAFAAAKPKPKQKLLETSPEAAPASSSGGGVMVQIGAFSSSALAEKGWSDDVHALPATWIGMVRKVEAASKDGKTFYRAYVGGFATRADAASFCTALKAKNKPCFVK